jgi:hypothetical protein
MWQPLATPCHVVSQIGATIHMEALGSANAQTDEKTGNARLVNREEKHRSRRDENRMFQAREDIQTNRAKDKLARVYLDRTDEPELSKSQQKKLAKKAAKAGTIPEDLIPEDIAVVAPSQLNLSVLQFEMSELQREISEQTQTSVTGTVTLKLNNSSEGSSSSETPALNGELSSSPSATSTAASETDVAPTQTEVQEKTYAKFIEADHVPDATKQMNLKQVTNSGLGNAPTFKAAQTHSPKMEVTANIPQRTAASVPAPGAGGGKPARAARRMAQKARRQELKKAQGAQGRR